VYHKRKDRGCEARILADSGDTLLIEARWPIGADPKRQQRNTVNVTREYFIRKYGEGPLNG
jgi:hypothetical protein